MIFVKGVKAGIHAQHAGWRRVFRGRLDVASEPKDMELPDLRLHLFGGHLEGSWSVPVTENWQFPFCFADREAEEFDWDNSLSGDAMNAENPSPTTTLGNSQV